MRRTLLLALSILVAAPELSRSDEFADLLRQYNKGYFDSVTVFMKRDGRRLDQLDHDQVKARFREVAASYYKLKQEYSGRFFMQDLYEKSYKPTAKLISKAVGFGTAGSIVAGKSLQTALEYSRAGLNHSMRRFFFAKMYQLEADGSMQSFNALPGPRKFELIFGADSPLKTIYNDDPQLRRVMEQIFEKESKEWEKSTPNELATIKRRKIDPKKVAEGSEKHLQLLASVNGKKALPNDESAEIPSQDLPRRNAYDDKQKIGERQREALIRANATFSNIRGMLGQMSDLMAATGAPPDMIEAMNRAEGIAALGVNATRLALGDPTAAIPTFMGIVGLMGSRRSSDGMAQFFELQKRILEKLAEIERKIDRYHVEQMEKLIDIDTNVLFAGAMLDKLSVEDAYACHDIRRAIRADATPANIAKLDASLSAFPALKRTYAPLVTDCLRGLSRVFHAGDDVHQALWLTPAKLAGNNPAMRETALFLAPDARIDSFLKNYHVPLWRTFIFHLTADSRAALLRPSVDVYALERKISELLQEPGKASSGAPEFVQNQIERMLDPWSIIEYTSLLNSLHLVYLLDSSWPEERDQSFAGLLPRMNFAIQTSRYRLVRAKEIIEIAIAQQNYLVGDVVLQLLFDAVYENWDRFSDPKSPGGALLGGTYAPIKGDNDEQLKQQRGEVRRNAIELLKNNALVRRNFALFALLRLSQSQGPQFKFNALGYRLALAVADVQQNPDLLYQILGQRFAIESQERATDGGKKRVWVMHFGDGLRIDLPTADEFQRGTLNYPAALSLLISVRERVVSELAMLDLLQRIKEKTDPSERAALALFLTGPFAVE